MVSRLVLLVALVACFSVVLVNAKAAEQDRRSLAKQEDALELAEFIQDMETFGRTGRRGRQMAEISDVFGVMADTSQVAGLVLRLGQALFAAIRYMTDMAMTSARQNADVWLETVISFVQMGGQVAVSYARSFSPNLAEMLENFLTSYDLVASVEV